MIINILSAYAVPLIKEINHPSLIQEWRLKIDAEYYKRNIDANLYKPSEKKKFNRRDSDDYWSTPIKETIQWFPFLTFMEHTENIMKKKGLI